MAKKTTRLENGSDMTSKKNRAVLIWVCSIIIGLVVAVGIGIYAGYSLLVGPGVDPKALELSKLPIDQLSPLPSSGQADIMERYCDVVTPVVAKQLGANGDPIPVKGPIGACDIPLAGGALIQLSSVGPYGQLSRSDNPHFAQLVTIAGLEGRIYNLSAPLSGECTLKLNTRSVTVPTINVRWYLTNELDRATKRSQSCEIAKKTAEVIAKTYVPLAGGTVYVKTIQKPNLKSISGNPCKIVNNVAALYGDVYDVQDDRNGKQQARENQRSQCTYEYKGNKAVVTLSMGGNLDGELSSTDTDRSLGALPARQAQDGATCSMRVELYPGVTLGIDYTATDGGEEACLKAELMQASSVKTLIDSSSVS